jgi:ABC-type antimicrobial peptide transport system permease subunit
MGATREHIHFFVARRFATIVFVGVIAGASLAWAGVSFLASKDASLAGTPIWLFVAAITFFLIGILGAAFLPAHRAAKIDPMVALRYE